jgi:putative hemolysin
LVDSDDVPGPVPKAADHFDWNGLRFEVMDMDRNRVDKVLVMRRPIRRKTVNQARCSREA